MENDETRSDQDINVAEVEGQPPTENVESPEPAVEPVVELVADETVSTIQSNESVTEVVPKTDKPKKRHFSKGKKFWLLFIALSVVVGVAVAVLAPKLADKYGPKVAEVKVPVVTKSVAKPLAVLPADIDKELERFITPTTGEMWLKAPKYVEGRKWLKSELIETYQSQESYPGTTSAEDQLKYYKPTYTEVGQRGGNTIYFVYGPADMGQPLYLFEQKPDGSVALIAKPQTTATYEAEQVGRLKDEVTDKVTIDTTTYYDSLSVPSKITLDNGELLTRQEYLGLSSFMHAPTDGGVEGILVKTIGSSTLYRTEKHYADTGLTNIGYKLHTPLGTFIGMDYTPNTLSLEKYSFDNKKSVIVKDYDGKMVPDTIIAIARGCGSTDAAVTRTEDLSLASIKRVGVTDTGRTVYMPSDDNAPLLKKAYQEYSEGWPENPEKATYADFIANHGLVIIENASKELLVYARSHYRMVGGCAKPVVYLYPMVTTRVSVSVGADVTISDPLYGPRGWQNVLAEPNGQLTYQGNKYDSLFWEGYGAGDYPGITSGTIVKHADAAKTMRAQLVAQGLNSKEIADFMAFWESKIPNKPYVRLTWLTTADMDNLAPLRISPKPQTVQRVFLDMGGYDLPFSLPKQQLKSFERRGFTVVEWGGLVNGKLQ